jgi:hypothetical protein
MIRDRLATRGRALTGQTAKAGRPHVPCLARPPDSARWNLAEHPRRFPPFLLVEDQEVNEVSDQGAAEVLAGLRVEGREQGVEVRIGHSRTGTSERVRLLARHRHWLLGGKGDPAYPSAVSTARG